jgi:hypothetical protein
VIRDRYGLKVFEWFVEARRRKDAKVERNDAGAQQVFFVLVARGLAEGDEDHRGGEE